MRTLAIAGAAALTLISGVARADVHYQGLLYVIGSTGSCDPFLATGITANADYHPAFAEGFPTQKRISALNVYYNILGLFGAHVIRLDNRNFPRSPDGKFETPNPFTELNVDWYDYKPAFPANLIVTSEKLTPAPNGFPSLTMTGRIANAVGNDIEATCVITFEFAGVQSQQ